MDEFCTPEEVATRLKVPSRTIRDWLRSGFLPGFKFGRAWRVKSEEMERFIAEGRHQPVQVIDDLTELLREEER
jgi:excisionase family DNA binding protein